MDYHVADIKDIIQTKMDIVSSKMVKSNGIIASNKDSASQDILATQRRVKVFGRRVD